MVILRACRGWLARLEAGSLADKRAFELLDAELMGLATVGYGVDVMDQDAQVSYSPTSSNHMRRSKWVTGSHSLVS
jgi:hypothetical protein